MVQGAVSREKPVGSGLQINHKCFTGKFLCLNVASRSGGQSLSIHTTNPSRSPLLTRSLLLISDLRFISTDVVLMEILSVRASTMSTGNSQTDDELSARRLKLRTGSSENGPASHPAVIRPGGQGYRSNEYWLAEFLPSSQGTNRRRTNLVPGSCRKAPVTWSPGGSPVRLERLTFS